MTTLYKLTTQDNCTRKGYSNETLWGENVTHSKPVKEDPYLCSSDVLHAYVDPRLAVILNPVHADIDNPRLWEAEGEVVVSEGQLKVGTFQLTTLKEIPLPEISATQKIAFGILCAKEVYDDAAWNAWADKWLSGEDRSKEAAYYAASAASAASASAAYASAAYHAAYASAAYHAASAAYASAAYAYASAAYHAAYASDAVQSSSYAKKDIDLIKILDEVMEKY